MMDLVWNKCLYFPVSAKKDMQENIANLVCSRKIIVCECVCLNIDL